MTRAVSVPEKTLEHWASQYITYLYRSKAALWWPPRGEDLELGWLPPHPGKCVRLELKTTTTNYAGTHKVKIDTSQLDAYLKLPLGRQPFYAFPRPFWMGSLSAAATGRGKPVTELGFSRSGRPWWFAEWMVVLTTAQVANVLSPDLAQYRRTRRTSSPPLVRFDPRHSTTEWRHGNADPGLVKWLDFWPLLERCGKPGWPQLIRLPRELVPGRRRLTPPQLWELLRYTAEQPHDDAELTTVLPVEDGYRTTEDIVAEFSEREPRSTVDADSGPLEILLKSRALTAGSRGQRDE